MKNLTIIAGGSKGLGAALTTKLISQQHEVYEFSRSGHSNQHIDCDFSHPSKAHEIFDHLFKSVNENDYGNINLIINTATLSPFGTIAKSSNEDIAGHLNINIETTMMLIQAFLKAFQATNCTKSMTYISSGAARRAIPGLALYSASKAFFERFFNTVAEEQNSQSFPVKCMVINPGIMNTNMQHQIRSQSRDDFPMVEMWTEFHQKGQLADPNDIAEVCCDLVINSGTNGGYYMAQELHKTQ